MRSERLGQTRLTNKLIRNVFQTETFKQVPRALAATGRNGRKSG